MQSYLIRRRFGVWRDLWRLGFAVVVGLGLRSSPALSQTIGSLHITIVDGVSQRPIVGVIANADSGSSATSDSAGVVRIGGLYEGLHTITVRSIGYVPARRVNVRVTRDKVTIVAFELDRSPVTLATVPVTADAFPRDPEQGVGRSTYTAEEIRRTPGAASDVFRAIETLPGVSSSGGEFSAFSVRGGGPRDNLILIDEIPFDKVTHLEGGIESDEAQGGRFSIFAPDLVRSADFRAGGFPAQYGGKSASVLSMQLRDGNTETPTLGARYDLLGWEADYDGPSWIHDGTSILFSARHENLGRALKLIGREDAGVPSFSDLIFKSTTALGANNKVTVLGIFAPEQVDRTVANILTESDTTDAGLYSWKENKGVIGVSWRALTGASSVVQTTAYFERYTRSSATGQAYPDLPIDGGRSIESRIDVLHTDESESKAGLRSVAHLTSGANTLIASLDVVGRSLVGGRAVAGADTLYTFDRNDPRAAPDQFYLVIRPDTYDANIDRRVTDIGVSSSYQRSFLDDGDVTIGARVERDGVSGRTNVVPRASATAPAIGGVTFSVAGGVYLQPLALRDLVGASGNSGLPPLRSVHAVAGLSRLLGPDVKMTVEGYYRSLSELPVRLDRTTGIEEAIGTGYASGLDVAIVRRLVDRFFGQVSYSYSVSRRDDHRGGPVYDADGSQPHSFNLLGGYTFDAHWSFSGKFKFAEGKPTDTFIVHDDVLPGSGVHRLSQEITAHNAVRFPDLHTLNARVDYQRQARTFGIDAFLDVLDVYNHLNVNNVRFVERTGRAVFDGVKIVPTFGLKILY